jgi:hypothetical protein
MAALIVQVTFLGFNRLYQKYVFEEAGKTQTECEQTGRILQESNFLLD